MGKGAIAALGVAVAMTLASGSALAEGNVQDGAKVYKKRCQSCHPTEAGRHKMGPSLAGIMGTKAGTVAGFNKYKGLKGSDIVWDDANMDKWLANPKRFLGRKTSMSYKLKNGEQRASVIAYIKTLE